MFFFHVNCQQFHLQDAHDPADQMTVTVGFCLLWCSFAFSDVCWWYLPNYWFLLCFYHHQILIGCAGPSISGWNHADRKSNPVSVVIPLYTWFLNVPRINQRAMTKSDKFVLEMVPQHRKISQSFLLISFSRVSILYPWFMIQWNSYITVWTMNQYEQSLSTIIMDHLYCIPSKKNVTNQNWIGNRTVYSIYIYTHVFIEPPCIYIYIYTYICA